jgi:hypothetical protein
MESWQNNIGIRLMAATPTILIEDGIALAENYLSTTGGWNPDNPAVPTGLGVPASGLSDDAVVALLLSQLAASQYEFTATVTLPVTFTVYANLAAGLPAAQVRDAVSSQVRDYINRIAADLPIGINTVSLPYVEFDSDVVGTTVQAQRVSYQDNLESPAPNILSVALGQVRDMYSLDTTWNIASVFTSDINTTVIFRKYIDPNYTAVDPTDTDQIVVGIDPDRGNVISGIRVETV